MRLAVAFCLIILCSLFQFSPTSACSGGAPFFIQDFEDHDVIVYATVLEVDERGYNAILQVNRYYKGEDGEYLAVMRYEPALEYTAAIRDYDTSCTYSGGGQTWIVGSQGYFALSNSGNGTYRDIFSQYQGSPHFFVQDGMIEYYDYDIRNEHSGWQLQRVLVQEFESLLLDYGARETAIQPEPNAYPLMRFLNITTESGQRYQLNPDRSISPLDPETSPMAISNDGSHLAFRIDDEQVGFQYLELTRKPFFEDITFDGGWLIPQPGQSAIFSPDSNFVAVGEENAVTIYMFDNYERGGYGQRMTMQVIAQTNISQPLDELNIVWSADSTTFAYQDGDGIWIWDIFESGEPQLAVSQEEQLVLLDLSRSGRYVRYNLSDVSLLLDIESNEVYENAIATPDERNIIFVQTEYSEDIPDINRKGDRQCTAPLSESCPIYVYFGDFPFEFFWYKHNQIAGLLCSEEACYVVSYHWQLAIGTHAYENRLDNIIPLVNALDYDLTYDQPVIAVDDYILEFGFYDNWMRDEPGDPPILINGVDLSNVLDSPIVDLEWGLPIFYRHDQQ
ncbi:MAG: hypothetical protein RLP44_20905 [Aggregatilineales bacterium]